MLVSYGSIETASASRRMSAGSASRSPGIDRWNVRSAIIGATTARMPASA